MGGRPGMCWVTNAVKRQHRILLPFLLLFFLPLRSTLLFVLFFVLSLSCVFSHYFSSPFFPFSLAKKKILQQLPPLHSFLFLLLFLFFLIFPPLQLSLSPLVYYLLLLPPTTASSLCCPASPGPLNWLLWHNSLIAIMSLSCLLSAAPFSRHPPSHGAIFETYFFIFRSSSFYLHF